MRNKTIAILVCVILCLGNIQTMEGRKCATLLEQYDCKWIEIGDVGMSAYFDGSWHYVNATLFRFGTNNMVLKVLYEYKFYNVITYIENNEIKCSVRIPYQGTKRDFGFVLQN